MSLSMSAPNTPKGGRRRNMNAQSNPSKKKISKDEKICQLKSTLKVSNVENARLQREIEKLKKSAATNGEGCHQQQRSPPAPSSQTEEQRQKFREAMRALKKVTVSQEAVIKTSKLKLIVAFQSPF